MTSYVWTWQRSDDSSRHVEIKTSMGLEVARSRACELFKEDPEAIEYITSHDPVIS